MKITGYAIFIVSLFGTSFENKKGNISNKLYQTKENIMDTENRNSQTTTTETTTTTTDNSRTDQTDQTDTQQRSPEINNNDEGVNDTNGIKRESDVIKTDEERGSQGRNVDASDKKVTGDESQRNVL